MSNGFNSFLEVAESGRVAGHVPNMEMGVEIHEFCCTPIPSVP